jgi:uncharacterized HhH-GPD family protein
MKGTLAVTGDPQADKLLNTDPLALLIGMLLDQQVPMEWAFGAPAKLKERLGGRLDAADIAAMPPADLEVLFRQRPALHRYPASMAKRVRELCQHIVDGYGGDAARIWKGAKSGEELFDRLRALPGYGEEKSKIFLALLAKRMGCAPTGWEQYAGPFADSTPRSVADIDSQETLGRVRDFKKMMKSMGKGKAD